MNKKLKIIIILALSLGMSCTSEDSESAISLEIDNRLKLEEAKLVSNNGILKYNEKMFIFNNNGITHKFLDNKLEYNYDFKNKVEFVGKNLSEQRNMGNAILIENPVTSEFIKIIDIVNLDNTNVQFNVVTSSGYILNGIKLDYSGVASEYSDSSRACPICWPIAWVVSELIEAIIDLESDNLDSNCKEAIAACGENGLASFEQIDGWFTDGCKVTCK